jgi:tetratricopeptide (TPR) repeat protein
LQDFKRKHANARKALDAWQIEVAHSHWQTSHDIKQRYPSADFLAGFAGLLVKEGRYSEAVPYYSRALKLQEAINGPQHASLANLLDSYAYALSKANRGEEAKRLTSRAKSIRG